MAGRGNAVIGKIQRSFYLRPEVAEALRRAAYERRESQSEIVESTLRREFGMPEARRWDGWMIRYGFLAGNLFGDVNPEPEFDEDESAREYARMCREAIEEAYPGAKAEIPFQLRTSGALPVTMTTRVFDPEGGDREPDMYPQEGSQIASDVERICGEIWERQEWLVRREA